MSDERIENLVVLPRRVVPQPTPNIHPGGDCGWCCLAGVMQITVQEAYDRFEHDPREGIGWYEMRQMLLKGEHAGWFDRVITDVPVWPDAMPPAKWAYGMSVSPLEWFNYVRMALDAGYYGFASVDSQKKREEPDHFVLIVGARERYVPHKTMKMAKTVELELLISCSSRATPDEEWVSVHNLLDQRGGYNIQLARPT